MNSDGQTDRHTDRPSKGDWADKRASSLSNGLFPEKAEQACPWRLLRVLPAPAPREWGPRLLKTCLTSPAFYATRLPQVKTSLLAATSSQVSNLFAKRRQGTHFITSPIGTSLLSGCSAGLVQDHRMVFLCS